MKIKCKLKEDCILKNMILQYKSYRDFQIINFTKKQVASKPSEIKTD